MSAYKIKININDTPEQEVFISFQCSVQSVPIVDNENISFKSQVTEFNGKTRTEIPITCVSSIYDDRMFSKINKLQKGNKVEIVGNLIKNDKEEIVVLVTYIVYFNANNFSNYDKKDLSKIPWLDSSNFTKKNTNEDQSHDSPDNLPDFINRSTKSEVQNINTGNEIIVVSNDEGMKNK